ncbi:MAG: hypothetical protein LBU16_00190 [Treponema sp.]|nr:hypothetical protein [Treponema sp.]
MKRFITLTLLFFCGIAFVAADDASVLPGRIGRVYLAPIFAFANGSYDTEGSYKDFQSGEGSMNAFALGIAAEYGVTDWISAAVQWTPAWMVASKVDVKQDIPSVGLLDGANANGPADLFIGAKFLLIGETAPLKMSHLRFALATGVKAPLPGPDFDDQLDNVRNNKAVTAANQDKHVLGLGVRGYADYVVNKNFFINFYTEFIGYPLNGKLSESGLTGAATVYNLKEARTQVRGVLESSGFYTPGLENDIIHYKDEVQYGYDLNMELEPVFSMPLGGGVNFTAGLPLNFHYSPAQQYDVSINSSYVLSLSPELAQLVPQSEPSSLFSLRPSVAFFFTGFLLPTEFKLAYYAPIAGENTMATHSLVLQVKIYFRI